MHLSKDLITYRWVSIGLCLAIIAVAGGGSMAIIWLRTEMSETAVNVAKLERQARLLDNENATLSAKIARVHNPEFLIANMPEGLRPTTSRQLIWVSSQPESAYIAEAKGEPIQTEPTVAATRLDADTATADNAFISFDLPLMNAPSGP